MLKDYKNAHLWLLIPFAIILLGFAPSYWLRFSEVPWRQHLHGLTATLWFILLIAQPYLITRGNNRQHRLYGMFALFIAGGVVLSALGAIPYNLTNEWMSDTVKYGLSFIDVIVIIGFAIAVLMAVKTASNVNDHAQWMVSTVFWAILPGLFRLVNLVQGLALDGGRLLDASQVLAMIGVLNIIVLGYLMFRGRRANPAYLAAAIGSVVYFVALPIGQMEWWRKLADALFTI